MYSICQKTSRFKDKCDVCGKWKNNCTGYKGMLVCYDCLERTHGKIELDEPVQTNIFDFLEESEEIKNVTN